MRIITSYKYIPGDQDDEGNQISDSYYEPIYEDVPDYNEDLYGTDTGTGTGTTTNTSDPSFWSNILNKLKVNGSAEQLAGIASLAGVMGMSGNNGQQGVYKGYQGGIPNYVAERTMKPIPTTTTIPATGTTPAQTVARRPGQGGIDYFSQMLYKNAPPTAATTHANGGIMHLAAGGPGTLGNYSDGGRLLRGPGDGVSDSIPATIGQKQPARLADGEFVVPARIVSEIGNGSTEAGARKLYAMMDRVQNARKKSIKNVAANTKADKYLPT
jgi:hypothetical protein